MTPVLPEQWRLAAVEYGSSVWRSIDRASSYRTRQDTGGCRRTTATEAWRNLPAHAANAHVYGGAVRIRAAFLSRAHLDHGAQGGGRHAAGPGAAAAFVDTQARCLYRHLGSAACPRQEGHRVHAPGHIRGPAAPRGAHAGDRKGRAARDCDERCPGSARRTGRRAGRQDRDYGAGLRRRDAAATPAAPSASSAMLAGSGTSAGVSFGPM